MDTLPVLGTAYRPRVLDGALTEALEAAGAVLIEGPRACGKTMTALHAANSFVFLDDPASVQLREVAPARLLDGAAPRLLDEWQLAPELWNLVRRAVDRATEPGRFILTGSAVPADDVTRHSGAGRFLRLRQRTLSWFERGDSTGVVSLRSLFAGEAVESDMNGLSLASVLERLVRPGFPALVHTTPERSRLNLRGYLDDLARVDLGRLADIRHAPVVIARLLRAVARTTASEVTVRTLARDLAPVAPGISDATVARYLELLERVFVIEPQTAWTPALRSRARLRTSDRLHLADPSLAAVALGADAGHLENDLNTAGLLFESAVVHDLLVLAQPLGGTIHHYRDSNGHELDAVIVLPDGRWGAVEVKLGAAQIAAGAASLNRAIAQIDESPTFRLVITGMGGTVTLDDGTVTCSLASLGP